MVGEIIYPRYFVMSPDSRCAEMECGLQEACSLLYVLVFHFGEIFSRVRFLLILDGRTRHGNL